MNTAVQNGVRGRVPSGSKTLRVEDVLDTTRQLHPHRPPFAGRPASAPGAAPPPSACRYPTWTAVQAFATVRYAVLPLPYRTAAAFRVPALAPL